MAMECPAILTDKKTHRIATVVLCVIQVILALMIIIPLALCSREAGGRCMLYTTKTGSGPGSVCGYIHAVTAIFPLCLCIARAAVTVAVLLGKLDQTWLVKVPVQVGLAVVSVLGCLLTLVAGGLVSHGFSILCSLITSVKCGDLPIYIEPTSSLVRNYHSHLVIVEGSVWCSWLLWILLVVVDVFALWKDAVLEDLPFIKDLPCFSGGGQGGNAARGEAGRNRNTNQSQRSGVMQVLRRKGKENTDSDGAPRTPPPSRPPPPRPDVPGGAAAVRPLMGK